MFFLFHTVSVPSTHSIALLCDNCTSFTAILEAGACVCHSPCTVKCTLCANSQVWYCTQRSNQSVSQCPCQAASHYKEWLCVSSQHLTKCIMPVNVVCTLSCLVKVLHELSQFDHWCIHIGLTCAVYYLLKLKNAELRHTICSTSNCHVSWPVRSACLHSLKFDQLVKYLPVLICEWCRCCVKCVKCWDNCVLQKKYTH